MRNHSSKDRIRQVGRLLIAAGIAGSAVLGAAPPGRTGAVHAAPDPHRTGAVAAAHDLAANPSATATAVSSATAISTTSTVATTQGTATPPSKTKTSLPKVKVSSVVHRTNGYQIGTYYFSGWSHGQNDNLTAVLTQSPLRRYEPLDGWYDDSQSQVDKQIVRASNAGIDFFAFDWYDTSRSPYATDKTLNEALGYYLTSKQRKRMNFCLVFVDFEPMLSKASEWPKLVDTWITYFKQPDYVRVNGKPLFIVFSPEKMRQIFGTSAKLHKALDYLRARAVKAHLPGVTVAVAATLVPKYNPGRIGQILSEGYDVTTGYNYHAMGNEKYLTPAPYHNLVTENEQMWDRVARNIPLPYIPVITSGWDQRFSARPSEQKTAIIYNGRTPAQFSCYAASARRWIDANAKRTVKERMVLVFAWNEIGEGGSIIPNKTDGTAYADALHRVFTARKAPRC